MRFDREWRRSAGTPPSAASASSATSRSTSRSTAPTRRTHAELFQRGLVAGAPPDDLSAVGQLWGNPLYDWGAIRAQGYRWWIERLRRTFELFDAARIDHFRGFVSYWAVPEGHKTAKRGRWRRGPGAELFETAERELGPLHLVAEDLGVITKPVEDLRVKLGIPGMVVMQFAFDGPPSNPHRIQNHQRRSVVYVATHDCDTALGWWRTLPKRIKAASGLPGVEPNWELIELALSSRAELAIMQAQDVLGLGSEARMNMPGTSEGNWLWQLRPGQLTAKHARRLHALTQAAGRV